MDFFFNFQKIQNLKSHPKTVRAKFSTSPQKTHQRKFGNFMANTPILDQQFHPKLNLFL